MRQTSCSDLPADAAQDMPLPSGGALAFVKVGTATGIALPQTILRCAPRRQAGFAAGRAAARDALLRAGQGGTVPGIADDGLPDWPAGWLGSISHSDEIAAALVAPVSAAQLLGLDVERIISADIATQIAPEIVPEWELHRPSGLEITQAFSAKEALYKALYPLTRQFREFSAARAGWPQDGGMTLTLTENWGADWPEGCRFQVIQRVAAGHVITVLWRRAVNG